MRDQTEGVINLIVLKIIWKNLYFIDIFIDFLFICHDMFHLFNFIVTKWRQKTSTLADDRWNGSVALNFN